MISKSLLESLAEARMDILYLERKAIEAKDKKTAEGLAARGKELKAKIAGLRGLSHEEWAAGARGLGARLKTAQARLKDCLRKAEKEQAWARHSAQALSALDDLIASAAKVLK